MTEISSVSGLRGVRERIARELAWELVYPGEKRCAICSFALAESADKGCVIGNCSYRPYAGSAEDERVSRHRATVALSEGIILAKLAALSLPPSPQPEPCFTCEGEQGLPASHAVYICAACHGEENALHSAPAGAQGQVQGVQPLTDLELAQDPNFAGEAASEIIDLVTDLIDERAPYEEVKAIILRVVSLAGAK